ncbi:hypothetical protein BSKO_00289 [Bryopsis sp. KO-2023]|nr:hypothetical protein BSKO_00289 [Bryopsis sp. KO-2023]
MIASIPDVLLIVAVAANNTQVTQAGRVNVSDLGDITSCPEKPWSTVETNKRERVVPIKFEHAFISRPLVTLTLSALDLFSRQGVRVGTEALNVTEEGFNLSVGVRCDSFAHLVQVTWTADLDAYGTGIDTVDA